MLSHQSDPFLKLTAQFVEEVSEAVRLRKQLIELADALRVIAFESDADTSKDIARTALAAYYAKESA
jgi:hypothetical protein